MAGIRRCGKRSSTTRTLNDIPNVNIWTVPARRSFRPPAANSVTLAMSGPSTQLKLDLKRASDSAPLATYSSSTFGLINFAPQPVDANDSYQFGYPLRLVESIDTLGSADPSAWMTLAERDVRSSAPPTQSHDSNYLTGASDPNQYGGTPAFADPDRLLDRAMGCSYNEDVPVFELPRTPLLSLGTLQHLQVVDARPFAIGNPLGGQRQHWQLIGQWIVRPIFFIGIRSTRHGRIHECGIRPTASSAFAEPAFGYALAETRRNLHDVGGCAGQAGEFNRYFAGLFFEISPSDWRV